MDTAQELSQSSFESDSSIKNIKSDILDAAQAGDADKVVSLLFKINDQLNIALKGSGSATQRYAGHFQTERYSDGEVTYNDESKSLRAAVHQWLEGVKNNSKVNLPIYGYRFTLNLVHYPRPNVYGSDGKPLGPLTNILFNSDFPELNKILDSLLK